jgi:hypothetical protein
MTIIEFLERNRNRKLSYALTDGYNVVICEPPGIDGKPILNTDIHSVLDELMKHYGLENESP